MAALKQSQKTKFVPEKKWLKYIWVYLLISDFLLKSQGQQKLVKKISHFTIQFCSKTHTHFTNLNSLKIIKATLPQHS